MNDYTVVVSIPVRAEGAQAAAAAQLLVFEQVRLAFSRGVANEDFVVPPVRDEDFATSTKLEGA